MSSHGNDGGGNRRRRRQPHPSRGDARGGHGSNKKPRRADEEAAEIAELEERIAATAPPRGSDAGIAPEKSAAGGGSGGGGGGNAKKNDAAASSAAAANNDAHHHHQQQQARRWPPMAGRKRFDELPLTRATLRGLALSGYATMTAVQRAALPHALAGRDVLGAAKTGSGKTLAFVVPLLESLRRARWSPLDGLGALVLSPTRELGTQIFATLGKVGRDDGGRSGGGFGGGGRRGGGGGGKKNNNASSSSSSSHFSSATLSAGLLVGGRDVAEESSRVSSLTVLVATPGRLLQHMDESPGFDASRLQVLVLDEADRLLDMGFAPTIDAILANLPRPRAAIEAEREKKRKKRDPLSLPSSSLSSSSSSCLPEEGRPHEGRQTLLFSATQTKRVADLARLSLRDPERVAVHEQAPNPTPPRLKQAFAVVALPDKADVLWAFVKSHLRCRVVVFFATCKQVRFFHEALRRLRPGTPLRALHGGMKQGARAAAFEQFVGDVTKGGNSIVGGDRRRVSGGGGRSDKTPPSPPPSSSSSTSGSGSGVLLATDVAARGLDFPAVDWVLQVDAPDDAAAYVHRVGRAARYTARGRALLLLTPSEKEGCLGKLREAGIPLEEVKINPSKGAPVTPALAALLSKSGGSGSGGSGGGGGGANGGGNGGGGSNSGNDLKLAAQRAVQAYARSVALQPDKRTFDARSMPIAEYAHSLGLAVAPRMRFLGGKEKGKGGKEEKAKARGKEEEDEEEGEEEEEEEGEEEATTESDGDGSEESEESEEDGKRDGASDDSDDDDDLMVVKRRDVFGGDEKNDDDGNTALASAPATPGQLALDSVAARRRKKKKLRIPSAGGAASVASGERVVFDDEGKAAPPLSLLGEKISLDDDGGGGGGGDDDDGGGGGRGERGDGDEAAETAAKAKRARTDGLDVGEHATARGRLASAAAALRERDALDKREYARARRERRLEKKARLRERLRGEEGERHAARLGSGGSGDSSSGGEESDYSSSPSDDEEGPRAPPRAVVDAAHKGMARRGEELAARMRKGNDSGVGVDGVGGRGDGGRDLAATEALALRLIAARRRGGDDSDS